MLNRRQILLAASVVPFRTKSSAAQVAVQRRGKRTGMGLVVYCRSIRRRSMLKASREDLFEPLTFLRHCHASGAGGMQARLGKLNSQQIDELRRFADEHDLFIDAVVSPPTDSADVSRFAAEIEVAAKVGVQAARTVIMPGRRYERFKDLAEVREFERRGEQMLRLAAPVVAKHRVRLAVENHKDQRLNERIALFRRLDHEYIGACLDTGNSFALLDDPYVTVKELAPFSFTVHLKDQGLMPYDDGFLLADTPLGTGSFDLPRMVKTIRDAKPDIRFGLELITRDALKVPCLSRAYWSVMPPQVTATELAAALRLVRDHAVASVAEVSQLSAEGQLALEDRFVQVSLDYARDTLGL